MYAKDLTFGSLVKQYIDQNALSYQDLVERLGYKSKTSVARIIQDATSYQLRAQFYKLFKEHYPLTEEESDTFESALNASRLSGEHQSLFTAYRRLFTQPSPEKLPPICVEYAEDARTKTLTEVIDDFGQGAYSIDVLLFGLCSPAILQALYRQLDDMSCTFTIRHCLFSQENASAYIHLLSATSDFLFDPRYVLYHGDRSAMPMHVDNQIILHCDMEDGESTDSLLLQVSRDQLFLSNPLGGELLSTYLRFFERHAEQISPLKIHKHCRSDEEQIATFLKMQQNYAALENNRSIYCYRKSLGLEFIPPDIYRDALLINRFPQKDSLNLVSELVDTQRKRYQNIRSKKAPSYFLLSDDAIQNFIWTGRLRNHPFLLRPFSPRERAIILKNLLTLLEDNPFFFLRFAAENAPELWDTTNVSCYQQLQNTSSHKAVREESLVFSPTNESSDEYALLQLINPDVVDSYAVFYRDELWQKYSQPSKKSEHFVHLMLQYLSSRGAT